MAGADRSGTGRLLPGLAVLGPVRGLVLPPPVPSAAREGNGRLSGRRRRADRPCLAESARATSSRRPARNGLLRRAGSRTRKSWVLFTDTHPRYLLPARLRDNPRLGIFGELNDSTGLTEPEPGTTRVIRRMRLRCGPRPFRAYVVPIVLALGRGHHRPEPAARGQKAGRGHPRAATPWLRQAAHGLAVDGPAGLLVGVIEHGPGSSQGGGHDVAVDPVGGLDAAVPEPA